MTAPAAQVWTAHPKQTEYADAVFSGRYSYLLLGGGIRGGKTQCTLQLLFVLCKMFPGSRWAIVRVDLPTLRRNTLPSYAKIRPAHFAPMPNQGDWTATCSNGSQIIFFSESLSDDPDYDRWKGLEVNGFLLEEANELVGGISSFNKAIERAGSWIIPGAGTQRADGSTIHQPPPLILLTCNPSPGWLKDTFHDPHFAGTLKAPYFFQPLTIADNPDIPEAYRESLKHLPEDQYKRFVLGHWDVLTGVLFEELRPGIHLVPNRPRATAGFRRMVAADWGTANIAPALWIETDDALDDAPRAHVYREWGPDDMKPVRWAEGVLQRSGYDLATDTWTDPAERIECVILDAAAFDPQQNMGPSPALQMKPLFQRAKVRLLPSVKGAGSVAFGVRLLKTYFDTYQGDLPPLLTIAEQCPKLWAALTGIRRGDPLKGQDGIPALHQHPWVDWLDALRYYAQSYPKAADVAPETLLARAPDRLDLMGDMQRHEVRVMAKRGVLDPIHDPGDRVEPVRKPWMRRRGR